jgi:hypothetical protein
MRSLRRSLALEPHQFRDLDLERQGNQQQRADSRFDFRVLDQAHMSALNADHVREVVLVDAVLGAEGANALPECDAEAFHSRIYRFASHRHVARPRCARLVLQCDVICNDVIYYSLMKMRGFLALEACMTGAFLGLVGVAVLLGALFLFALSFNRKLVVRYPATRKQSGFMALFGVVAFIIGVATAPSRPTTTQAAVPLESPRPVVERQGEPTPPPSQPAAPRISSPAPQPTARTVNLSLEVTSYISGQQDGTGDVVNFQNGTMQGVTWIPAPSAFQAPEMHVYRVNSDKGEAWTWSVQWFGSKRSLSELVGTPSIRFLGTRGMQRVSRVENGIFKGRIVTTLSATEEIRISTLEYLRMREPEFASWLSNK